MDAQYEVRLTHQAMMQLQAIRDYISDELCAPDAAINLLRLLKKEMDSLSRMPQRIALTGEEPWRS